MERFNSGDDVVGYDVSGTSTGDVGYDGEI